MSPRITDYIYIKVYPHYCYFCAVHILIVFLQLTLKILLYISYFNIVLNNFCESYNSFFSITECL